MKTYKLNYTIQDVEIADGVIQCPPELEAALIAVLEEGEVGCFKQLRELLTPTAQAPE